MTDRERAEFERQKKEAERQLNEMYYGSSQKGKGGLKMPPFLSPAGGQGKPKAEGEKQKQPVTSPPEEKRSVNRARSGGFDLLNILNLKSLKMDGDRMLILALILLLSGEETDELLSLALLYIML